MAKKFSFADLLGIVRQLMQSDEVTGQKISPKERYQQEEIENAILLLTAEVIRCDRNFAEATEKHVIEYLNKQFGTSNRKLRVDKVAQHVELRTEAFVRIACKELKILTTYDSRLNIIHFLFGVAASDDFINEKEIRCLSRVAEYIGINADDFQKIRADFHHVHNPYTLLEIKEGATLVEVKSAYRKMILKYHPDKRDKHTEQKEAEEKFLEVKRAYESICRELGS